MRYGYSLLFYLILPFILLRLLWRSRLNPAYRKHILERLGIFPKVKAPCIWIHVVSLGETIAALPLIKQLKALYPATPLLITNMTPTGAAKVKATFGESVIQRYIPYDLPFAVSYFLQNAKPIVAIIFETELWPNLLDACHKRHIPIVITNARLSAKSFKRYQLISNISRAMLKQIATVSAQADYDAKRFIALGLPPHKIKVTGNLKFDIEIAADIPEKGRALRKLLGENRLIWIAASTHAPEETLILKTYEKIKKIVPDALLILVPRHPERFNAVAAQCQNKFKTLRRSLNESPMQQDIDIYLGDTIGELLTLYAAADIVFVGGSFSKIGGHNLLEPAALHKPIVSGPHLFNFSEIRALLVKAKGLHVVKNEKELEEIILNLFHAASLREEIGTNAYRVVQENRGALRQQLNIILNFINAKMSQGVLNQL